MAIGFFFGIDCEPVISGGSENVDTASFHHGPDLMCICLAVWWIARTLAFSGRSGCACIGAFIRTRRQGCHGKCFVKAHVIGFMLKPKRDIR